jgi:hypothetical protein
VRDGEYTISVEAVGALGRRGLVRSVRVDTTPPGLELTSVTGGARSTKLRFRLSEPARIKVWLGTTTFSLEREAGDGVFWQRVKPARVRVVGWDRAGNRSAGVVAIRRPGRPWLVRIGAVP